MVESEKYDEPPTHVVSFVWSNGCQEGEEVYLVGDFTGNWKDSIRLAHKGMDRDMKQKLGFGMGSMQLYLYSF
ncbi:hypothetical protein Taro_035161 [Colocasia esculenta]|uniref:Uncharacterized protein n=1 Tax=Colocasia esculenta TaxID=4460 RepID=A0A843WCD3_COLES|nr:hypothetical protein [Colocasia esculenta]